MVKLIAVPWHTRSIKIPKQETKLITFILHFPPQKYLFGTLLKPIRPAVMEKEIDESQRKHN